MKHESMKWARKLMKHEAYGSMKHGNMRDTYEHETWQNEAWNIDMKHEDKRKRWNMKHEHET
jgi:hypothetical protein